MGDAFHYPPSATGDLEMIKIHHGPPGAFKTSGAIADDLKQPVYSGRTTITNIRGLDEMAIRQTFLETFKKSVPEEWKLINLSPDEEADRERMKTFFHWAPRGAFFIVDEVGEIWDPSLTEKQLQEIDFPGGAKKAEKEGRLHSLKAAFRLHRQFEWDFVFTAQDIGQVHKVIRQCSELAYYHKNLKTLGVSTKYVEYMHSAKQSGLSKSHYIEQNLKTVPKWVFGLYESTITGGNTDAKFGTSIFKQFRVVMPLVVSLLCGVFLLSKCGGTDTPTQPDAGASSTVVPKGFSEGASGNPDNGSDHGRGKDSRKNGDARGDVKPPAYTDEEEESPLPSPLERAEMYWQPRWYATNDKEFFTREGVLYNYDENGGVLFVVGGKEIALRRQAVLALGIFIHTIGPCVVRLRHRDGWDRLIACRPEPVREPPPEEEIVTAKDEVEQRKREKPTTQSVLGNAAKHLSSVMPGDTTE